ncbi:CBS domain-containing protein [Nocardiopsis baichengensis]|uniref:CBS domain-containing protein n=1 Tax=Nocardiopsis baichengensis TaxID=280240 RepID=UPI000369D924|nr:CBS domain-containing protein [Nocardiopsis baichengensis]
MTIRVRNVMTNGVIAVRPSTGMREIALLLSRYSISAVPVVDEDGQVLGVVSESDLLYKLTEDQDRGDPSARTKRSAVTARRLMTEPPVTVDVRAEVAEAAGIMEKHRVKRLPVISEDGRLIGIVSRSDLVRIYTRPDSWIQGRVERLLLLEFDEPQVKAEVRNGIVTLHGKVRLRSSSIALGRAVRHIEGVVHAENRIAFAADDISPFSLMAD